MVCSFYMVCQYAIHSTISLLITHPQVTYTHYKHVENVNYSKLAFILLCHLSKVKNGELTISRLVGIVNARGNKTVTTNDVVSAITYNTHVLVGRTF